MRIFAAIMPPLAAVEDLEEFLESRRAAPGAPRWADEGQWHVTLAFAAEASLDRLDAADEDLREVCAGVRAPELSIAGGGVFPDVTRARVLWAGLRGADRLDALASRLRNTLAGHGIACAGGDFTPHVTLGRWRAPVEATRWLRVLDTYEGPAWTAPEVAIVASRLGAGRDGHPAHETLAAYPFDDGTPARWWADGRRLDAPDPAPEPAPDGERWWAAGRLLDRE